MQRTTRRWVTGAALSASVLMVGAPAALAQSDDSSTTTAEPRGGWMTTVLDQLVASGTITRAQADAITQAMQDARPAIGERGGRGEWGERGGPRGRYGVSLDAAAETLGLTVEELRTQLRDGATLAEIATAQGVDVQQVVDALTAAAEARLDAAVADGTITQAQADERLAAASERIEAMVEEPLPPRGEGRHRPPATTDDPAPTTTEG